VEVDRRGLWRLITKVERKKNTELRDIKKRKKKQTGFLHQGLGTKEGGLGDQNQKREKKRIRKGDSALKSFRGGLLGFTCVGDRRRPWGVVKRKGKPKVAGGKEGTKRTSGTLGI